MRCWDPAACLRTCTCWRCRWRVANTALALVAFLGGLSAATSMVVIATLTLSLMMVNHFFAPLRVRAGWGRDEHSDLRGELLNHRRVAILVVIMLAWAYSRLLGAQRSAGRHRRDFVFGAGQAGAGVLARDVAAAVGAARGDGRAGDWHRWCGSTRCCRRCCQRPCRGCTRDRSDCTGWRRMTCSGWATGTGWAAPWWSAWRRTWR